VVIGGQVLKSLTTPPGFGFWPGGQVLKSLTTPPGFGFWPGGQVLKSLTTDDHLAMTTGWSGFWSDIRSG